MKKVISTILFLCFLMIAFSINSYAQERRYGIKGGFASYQIQGQYTFVQGGESIARSSDPQTGIEAGFFIEFSINKSFSIQQEVVYIRKGGKKIYSLDTPRNIRLDYVDFPVLLKFRAPVNSIFIPYMFGGPYGSLLIRAKGDFEEYGKHTITDQYRKIAYGLKFGIGVEIGKIMIGGQYDLGIADVYKYAHGIDEYARGFAIGLGIIL